MIVIAAYNRVDLVENLLTSMNNTIDLDEDVLIMCTNRSMTEMIDFSKTLPNNIKYNYNIKIDSTPYNGYDTGAYIYAYKNYESDYYIFLHDSITVNSPEWLNEFKNRRKEDFLTAWCVFDMNTNPFDNSSQSEFINSVCKDCYKKSPYGVFGPMFQIHKLGLKKIDEAYGLDNCIPNSKVTGQQGMERLWPYMAVNVGLEIDFMEPFTNCCVPHCYDTKYFKKHLQGRP